MLGVEWRLGVSGMEYWGLPEDCGCWGLNEDCRSIWGWNIGGCQRIVGVGGRMKTV